jgi:hypothetical protein
MQRRVLLIVLVFVAGFAVGYGLTWVFVGSPKRAPTTTAQEVTYTAVATGVTADASEPADVPAMPTDASTTATDSTLADAALPSDALVANTAVPDAGPALADAAPTPEVIPAEAPTAEWERCLNKVCRLDFGGVGGAISIRRGKFDHGATIDWEKDFSKADKIGSLDSDKTIRLEVLAVGLSDGEPAAAYVSRKLKKSTQVGVIALRIGDKRLSLVPIED